MKWQNDENISWYDQEARMLTFIITVDQLMNMISNLLSKFRFDLKFILN